MLDDFSQRFADVLFARYPEWRQFIEEGETSFSLMVPAINPNIKSGLYIDTIDEEITVGTDWYHSHFWGNDPQQFKQAMNTIDGILNSDLVVLAYFNGDSWTGSKCVGSKDEWAVPKVGERRLIISWNGSLDVELFG
jgi:hypothetical protein